MRRLNAFQINSIMVILMVLEHLYYIPGLLSGGMMLLIHILTRCAIVWFAYMAFEEFIETRNRIKYNVELFIWAVIVYIGNYLLWVLFGREDYKISSNIIMTIAVGILILNVLCYGREKEVGLKSSTFTLVLICRFIAVTALLAVGIVKTELGYVLLPFLLITYLARKNKQLRNILYLTFCAILFLISYCPGENLRLTLYMTLLNGEWFFITVLPFLNLYNGKRKTKNKVSKYFFYLFYPTHIWILYIIGKMQ